MINKRAPLGLVAGLVVAAAAIVTAPAAGAAAATGAIHSVPSTRILDTRTGTGAPKAAVGAHKTVALTVTGTHGGVTVPPEATSVIMNVTVTNASSSGNVTVYGGAIVPHVSNLNYVKGQTVPNLVITQVVGGKVNLFNNSTGTIALVADLTGYVTDGATAQGGFGSVTPTRLLDTRVGTGAPKAAVAAQHTVTFTVAGAAGVPAGVSAVALNITAVSPTAAGFITAYGGSRPSASNLNFAKGQTVPNLAIVPVSASGKVTLFNGETSGSVQLLADISGYFAGGDPVSAGALGALSPVRLLDTRTGNGATKAAVGSHKTVTVTVAGRGGVPLTNVAAVVLNVTATSPTASGFLTAFGNAPQPTASTLNFAKSQTVANLAIVGPSSAGKVTFYNGSSGTVQIVADVSGYVLGTTVSVPAVSTSRYVRNLTVSDDTTNAATMTSEGGADHASAFVVLDIGAQLNSGTGVQLSATGINVTYAHLVTALNAYLSGYADHGGTGTIAIATSNSADFTLLSATARGTAWANQVIDAVTVPPNVTIVGADDIEAGFAFEPGGAGSTEAQAEQWITAYLAATTRPLVYIGSADGCPSTYGTVGATCNHGWTEAQYYKLSHGINTARVSAVPQIYTPEQAVQWANIAKTGGTTSGIHGALTEYAACPVLSGACTVASLTPAQGWAALRHALSTVVASPALPIVTDLQSDTQTS